MFRALFLATAIAAIGILASLKGGEFPRTLEAYPGKTPVLDGVISPGEWDDATQFSGVADWIPQFSKTTDAKDLALKGWVKHDGKRLYFAFEVTDDVLYGIDTPRWLPKENPKAHEEPRSGKPLSASAPVRHQKASPQYSWRQRAE